MFAFHIEGDMSNHSEISEWLTNHRTKYAIFNSLGVRDRDVVMLIDVEINDELIALQFRMAFNASIGMSKERKELLDVTEF